MSRHLMSVFTARSSTPSIPLDIIWLRALLPPPPTAITFMHSRRAGLALLSMDGLVSPKGVFSFSGSEKQRLETGIPKADTSFDYDV